MPQKLTVGPIFPKRAFTETALNFRKVKLQWSINNAGLRIIGNGLNDPTAGLICGLQAVTWEPEFRLQLLGTAFFVGPGVIVTAWHILEDFLPTPVEGKYDGAPMEAEFQVVSMRTDKRTTIWPIGGWSVGKAEGKGSDVTVATCHLSGDQPADRVQDFAEISFRSPVIGEKVCVVGYKEPEHRKWRNRAIRLQAFQSVGEVIDVFPMGNGQRNPGACFAISSGATGGMSGAPVFASDGRVIGVLSSGVEGGGDQDYSIVSSMSPAQGHKLTPTWNNSEIKENLSLSEFLQSLS